MSAERYRALPWRREVKFPEMQTFVEELAIVAARAVSQYALERELSVRITGPYNERARGYPAIRLGTAETITVIADHDLGDCT